MAKHVRTRTIFQVSALAIITALSWASNSPQPTAHAAKNPYITASPGHPDYRFGAAQAYADPRAASNLGIGWERITMFWGSLEPAPGVWNNFFTKNDSQLLTEVQAGRMPVGVLVSTPRWARVKPNSSVPKGLYDAWNSPKNTWGNFVYRLARHYAGMIDTWVIGNEISIPSGHFNTWNGTLNQFAQMVKVAYLAAHAGDPNAHILLPATPYWYSHGHVSARLISDLAALRGASTHHDFFNAVDLNLYNTINFNQQIYSRYRRILAAHGLSDTPIWLSESNVTPTVKGYIAPKNDPGVTPAQQAAFIVEEMADSLSYTSRVEVYQLPEPPKLNKFNGPVGLLTATKKPRPAYTAYQTLIRYLSGARYLSRYIPPFSGTNPAAMDVVNFGAPRRFISVIWDQGSPAIVGRVHAYSASALLVNDQGQTQVVHPRHGVYSVKLPASTLSSSGNSKEHPIGGNPYFVIQVVPLGSHGTPLRPDFGSRTGFPNPTPTPWTQPPLAALAESARVIPEIPESVSGSTAPIAQTAGGSTTYSAVVNTDGDQIWVKVGNKISHFGTPGSATGDLNMPSAAAWSPQHTLYVADQGNARIEEFSASGHLIRSFGHFGTTGSGMVAPSGIAVAPNRSVYVTDSGTQRVLHFSATGKFLGSWGKWGDGNGQFDGPSGIAVATNGTVFVADTLNNRVQSFTSNGTYLQQGAVPYPEQIQLQANGSMLVTNFRAKTFAISQWPSYVGTLAGKPHPTALTFATDGKSYYEALANGSVIHFSLSGQELGSWTVPPVPGNKKPTTITQLAVAGNVVYALDSLYNRILILFPTTSDQSGVVGWLEPGGQGVLGPRAMAVAKNGSIWVADTDNHEIVHLSKNGTILNTFKDPDSPYGIAIGRSSLWISGYYGGVLSRYSPSGKLLGHFFQNGSGVQALHRPTELLADGNNWVIWDRGDGRVALVSRTGQILSEVSDTLGNPVSMALEPNGNVAFLNSSGQSAVYHFGPSLRAMPTVTVRP